jgi:biotin-[acetyl-CoA-carboxylase] ligase BirA-like protein
VAQKPSDNSDPLTLVRVGTIDSTNLEARRRIAIGLDTPLAIVAHRQTAGLGRRGRRWESPAGGLWLTAAWPADWLDPMLGLRCALIVAEAVDPLVDDRARIRVKWPNDVMLDGRKLAGVLVESVVGPRRRWAVVGIGVNADLSPEDLSADVRPTAATLRQACAEPVDVPRLERNLLDGLSALLRARRSVAEDIRTARARLWGIRHDVTVSFADGEAQAAVVAGLSVAGALIVRRDHDEWEVPPGATVVYRGHAGLALSGEA